MLCGAAHFSAVFLNLRQNYATFYLEKTTIERSRSGGGFALRARVEQPMEHLTTEGRAPAADAKRRQEFLDLLCAWNDAFAASSGRRRKAFLHTYGCQMNEHDSETLLGMLLAAGFEEATDQNEADLILFNTCCVREHAQTRVYGNVGALAKRKLEQPGLLLGVCGCMMQQKEVSAALYKRFPFVDLVFGTHALPDFPALLYRAAVLGERVFDGRGEESVPEGLPICRKKGASAFVTIMYGCNNFCSYCIVPYVRGRERSRAPEDILKEVKGLVKEGYTEVTLLGQNVNSYGKDRTGNGCTFPELLRLLNSVEGLERLRFMTSHPKDLSDGLISAMAECARVCKHIHLPVQSGSDEILRRMNRHYTASDYAQLVKKLRASVPGIEISTDIIVGFPGETEEDFEATLRLVEDVGFCAAYTFMYSPRIGTPAASWPNQIPDDVKHERLARLNALQAKKCVENNEKYIGTVQEVLVEGCDEREGQNAFGKTSAFKMIYFPGDESLIGKMLKVKVTKARSNSLLGEACTESGK